MDYGERDGRARNITVAILLNSGLAGVLIVAFLVYAAIGVVLVALLVRFDGDAAASALVAAMFAPITTAFGYLYVTWLRESMDGYTIGPERYRKLCTSLTTFAYKAMIGAGAVLDEDSIHRASHTSHDRRVYEYRAPPPSSSSHRRRQATLGRALLPVVAPATSRRRLTVLGWPSSDDAGDDDGGGGDDGGGRPPRVSSPSSYTATGAGHAEQAESDAADALQQICDACIALVFYGYRMFRLDDTASLNDDVLRSPTVRAAHRWVREQGDDFDWHDMERIRSHLCAAVYAGLRALAAARVAADAGARRRFEQAPLDSGSFELVERVLDDSDAEHSLPSPCVFQRFITVTLVVYFGAYIPLTLWSTAGSLATVLSYPFIMVLLTGTSVFRWWLGDPFDPRRPVVFADFNTWRNRAVVRMLRMHEATRINRTR